MINDDNFDIFNLILLSKKLPHIENDTFFTNFLYIERDHFGYSLEFPYINE